MAVELSSTWVACSQFSRADGVRINFHSPPAHGPHSSGLFRQLDDLLLRRKIT